MPKRKAIDNIARYLLVFLLALNFAGLVFVAFINPETYFFGEKLNGGKAVFYLLVEGFAGIIIAYLLFKTKFIGAILTLLYFGYLFIDTLLTNLSLGFGFVISLLATTGLVASIILLANKNLK